jgi:hypothetical protein
LATRNIYVMIDHQVLDGQRILNVWGYHYTGTGTGSAANLNTAWIASILTPLQNIQSNQLTRDKLETFDPDDPTNFEIRPYLGGGSGQVAGDYLSPFVAYTYVLVRPTRLVRNGFKRFAGVPEAASQDGQNLTSAYHALSNTLETAMKTPLTGSGGDVWTPCILHRPGPGHPLYLVSDITNVQFSHFGSQNTRKIGRGG